MLNLLIGFGEGGLKYMARIANYKNILSMVMLVAMVMVTRDVASEQRKPGRSTKGKTVSTIMSRVQREPTAEEVETFLEEWKNDLGLLNQRTEDFSEIVDGMVLRIVKKRRGVLDSTFKRRIDAEEELVNQARLAAIDYFERFLKKYPDTPKYTPDAMYRLAELYYDDSFIKALESTADYDEADGDASDAPDKTFIRSINMFRGLIARYPDYRNIDGVYYLLGYILNETGLEKEAVMAWLNLVCANKYTYVPGGSDITSDIDETHPSATLEISTGNTAPFVDPFTQCQPVTDNSRFFFESWWFVGNYYFDQTDDNSVETAIIAYEKLIEDPSHKFYGKGLYKLAWSYFKASMYQEAIKSFGNVIDYSDSKVEKQAEMRPEAIQYIAVAFWDLDTEEKNGIALLQDPNYLPQDRPWTREIYYRLGEIFYDNVKNEEAIAIWELYLEKWPLDIKAPFVQQKIAFAYNKMKTFPEKEMDAISALDKYTIDSEWWKANEDHPAEQNKVARMSQDALLRSAIYLHKSASAHRKHGLAARNAAELEKAMKEYFMAAEAYRKFIKQNPDTTEAYEINYNLAEALFWSGRYEDAKKEYLAVRDSNLDDQYRTESAHQVIVCLERIVERGVKDQSLVMRKKAPDPQGDPLQVMPLPLPPIVQELMTEREAFLKGDPSHAEAAKFKYQSAQNYYRYGHWEDAKAQYEKIYDEYCADEMATISWKTMMQMAESLDDLNERERLAYLQQEKQCGKTEGGEGSQIDTILGDVAIQRSKGKYKKCEETRDIKICSEAGDILIAAVTKAPEHPFAAAALNNAAVAYERAGRFKTVMEVYGRMIEEYPESEYVGKALFQQGLAAQKFFEYNKALDNYQILADEDRFKEDVNRAVAVYNSADILTNLQNYRKAVSYWERYAKEESDQEKSVEASFNAADMHFRAGQWKDAEQAYRAYIKRNGTKKYAGEFVVKASYRISVINGKKNRKKDQLQAWKDTVRYYENLVAKPKTMSAEYAAESHFMIIEKDMREFENFSIKGSQKVITEKIKEGEKKVADFEIRYSEILKYERPEWFLAAVFRIGYAYEVYAKAMLDIPMPPLDKKGQKLIKSLPPDDREMVMLELEGKFQDQMAELVAPMEEKAKTQYMKAVELARKGNISNEWTLEALNRMNNYDPDNYPRQHNGMVAVEKDTLEAPMWGEVK